MSILSEDLPLRKLADLDTHILELRDQKVIVYLFSSHREGDKVTDHVGVHL